jgi:hypothetical protein
MVPFEPARQVRAKPELVCPVESCAESPLPVGRVDLSEVPSGYSYSGFAIVVPAAMTPEARMQASVFYRIAAVLLLFFAVGHTLGFRESDPAWGVDTLLGSMRSIHFDVQGFHRTYWDLFVAAGFSVGVFYLFAAVLAWQLGGLPAETLAVMRVTVWAFALCFGAITVVSWRYLFILPIAFSIVITLCLAAAAWLSAKQVPMPPVRQ